MARWRIWAGTLILGFQLTAIVYARFVPARYFCWAPFDMQTDYEIQATVAGQPLSGPEIRRRYRRAQQGVDNRAAQHLIDIIEGVESAMPPEKKADIVIRYRVNGKQERVWRRTAQR